MKWMKTRQMVEGGRMTAMVSHNITAITEKGSPVSSQIWEHSVKAVAAHAMKWYERGEAGRAQHNPWNEPIAHIFIAEHGESGLVFHYDMSKDGDVEALREMVLTSK